MLDELANFIKEVGFPVAVAVILLVRMNGKLDRLTKSLDRMNGRLDRLIGLIEQSRQQQEE